MSYVYFISNDSAIKIGKANNVNKRLVSLQTGSNEPLTLLKTINCHTEKQVFKLEKYLHTKWSKYRLNGEWFEYNKNMLKIDEHQDNKLVGRLLQDMDNDPLLKYQVAQTYYDSKITPNLKAIYTKILYTQTLHTLSKRYPNVQYINYKKFKKIMALSGTTLRGINNSLIELKFADPEYLSDEDIINAIPKNEIVVKEPVTINDISYNNSEIELKNEKVISLIEEKEFSILTNKLQEQYRDIQYKIDVLPENEIELNLIDKGNTLKEKLEVTILNQVVDILNKNTLGTTDIRNLLIKNISSYKFTARDVKTHLKTALELGVKKDLLTLTKQKQSRFYTVAEN
jgi:hypothetical protein